MNESWDEALLDEKPGKQTKFEEKANESSPLLVNLIKEVVKSKEHKFKYLDYRLTRGQVLRICSPDPCQ